MIGVDEYAMGAAQLMTRVIPLVRDHSIGTLSACRIATRKVVTLVAGKLAIYDLPQLERIGMFNPGYLHLNREASSA